MKKTILITGSTDGIGLAAAQLLCAKGHHVLLHGRNQTKLDAALEVCGDNAQGYLADLSNLTQTLSLADTIKQSHTHLDVLINNAGILKAANTQTRYGIDVRFVVNTLSPYLLTQQLLTIIPNEGRVVNISSAAQSSVNPSAIEHGNTMTDMEIYAQSKLAILMWSNYLAHKLRGAPVMVSVNPGSLLATKMVKEGFGMDGKDINIGRDILVRAAIDQSFRNSNGKYFDNDSGNFAAPHLDAEKIALCRNISVLVERLIASNIDIT